MRSGIAGVDGGGFAAFLLRRGRLANASLPRRELHLRKHGERVVDQNALKYTGKYLYQF